MNFYFKYIYKKSPIWLQDIIISLYGFKVYNQRYGSVYHLFFNELIKKDYSNYKVEVTNQEILLQEFLLKVVDKSKFYKDLYKDINLSKIKKIEDLKLLPIVNKEKLRKNINDVYTIKEKNAIKSFTGGTTGKSLKILFSKDDFQKRMAYLDAFKYKVGVKTPFKVKKATFSGRDIITLKNSKIFWRNNYIYKQRLYSTFNLTEENLPYYIKDLNSFKPNVINGFVSAIYELAVFINRNNLVLNFKPKAIFTTSETLLPFHRQLIEKVFNAPIYNQYASAEGAPFITECNHNNLHYNLDTGIIETLETPEGKQMVITSFTTSGTPLIRYNIEDCITFKKGVCGCGSAHPLVERIDGRKVDYLFSKDKGKISLSQLADVIKGIPNSVKKMQFLQVNKDYIIVYIVIDTNLFVKRHYKEIMNQMIFRFGNNTEIEIKKVKNIPLEKSGKYSLIKNNIQKLKIF
mgnify:CR=1 FL=1